MDQTEQRQATERINARVCVVGGGPAGVMAGYLLARAGVDVVVLEKHGDFLRDFRGDTVHPSTLEVMWQLGLLEGFLARKHQQYPRISGRFDGTTATIGDFSRLPTHCKFVALMPQWDFLNFLTEEGKKFSTFRVLMRYQATDLLVENGRVVGVAGTSPNWAVRSARGVNHRRRRPPLHHPPARRISKSMISARRSTSSGCGCRRNRTMPSTCSAISSPARCW